MKPFSEQTGRRKLSEILQWLCVLPAAARPLKSRRLSLNHYQPFGAFSVELFCFSRERFAVQLPLRDPVKTFMPLGVAVRSLAVTRVRMTVRQSLQSWLLRDWNRSAQSLNAG